MSVQLGSAYGQIILDASGVGLGVRQAQGALGGLQSSMGDVGTALTTRVTLPLIGVGAAAGKVAGDFESQMATLSVAARSSGTSLEDLREVALKTGADTSLIGISASQSAEAIEELYKAGLSTEDIFGKLNDYLEDSAELSGTLRAAVDLQAASELNLTQASELTAISMATFGLKADQATRIVDNFVQSADASVTSVGELGAAIVNVGPTAAAFGWTLEETNAALAILSERGIRGSEAGTALKSMMTNVMRPTDEVTDTLRALNVALYDAEGRMRSLPDILGQLEAGMAGLTEEEQNLAVQTLAGTYGMKAMNTLLDEGVAGWRKMEDAIAGAATAQDVAQARTDTFQGSVEALMGTVETLLIQVGTPLINDFLRPAAEWLSELVGWFTELPPEVQRAAVTFGLLAAGMGPTLRIGSSLVGTLGSLTSGGRLLVTGLTAAPGLIRDVGAGLQLLRGGAGVFEVASTGAAGLTATLLPLAAAVGAVTVAYAELHDYQEMVAEGMQKVEGELDSWTGKAEEMIGAGKSSAEVMAVLADKANAAGEAMRRDGNVIEDLGAAWFRTHHAAGVYLEVAEEGNRVALRASNTYESYIQNVLAFNDSLEDQGFRILTVAEAQEKANRIFLEDISVTSRAEAMNRVLASSIVMLSEEQYAARERGVEWVTTLMGMARETLAAAKATEASDRAMLGYANAVVSGVVITRELGQAVEELIEVQETEEERAERLRKRHASLVDILEQTEDQLAFAGIAGDSLGVVMDGLSVKLGTTSEQAVKLRNDTQLIVEAFAEGTLSTEEFVDYMNRAADETLDLSEAQRRVIAGAMEHARAMREAAAAADEYRLMLLQESEALKDAAAVEAARIALKRLEADYQAGAISLDQYELAVVSVQDAYGLATPQSRALAAAIGELNDGLAAGKYAPEEYAAAVEAARLASKGGEDTVAGLMEAVEEAIGPFEEGAGAITRYGDEVETARLAAEQGQGSVAGLTEAVEVSIGPFEEGADAVVEYGDEAAAAAGKSDRLADAIGRARGELENITGHEWTVRVGTAGTLPPGVTPVPMATGIWNVPYDELPATLHRGEMVVPATMAEALREIMTATPPPVFPAPSATGGGGTVTHVTVEGDRFETHVYDRGSAALLAAQIEERRRVRLNSFMGG